MIPHLLLHFSFVPVSETVELFGGLDPRLPHPSTSPDLLQPFQLRPVERHTLMVENVAGTKNRGY